MRDSTFKASDNPDHLEPSKALLSSGDKALVQFEEVGQQLPQLLLLHRLKQAGRHKPLQAGLFLHSLYSDLRMK